MEGRRGVGFPRKEDQGLGSQEKKTVPDESKRWEFSRWASCIATRSPVRHISRRRQCFLYVQEL